MKLPSIRSIIISLLLLIVLSVSLRLYYQLFFNLSNTPKPFMYKDEWLQEGAGMQVLPSAVQTADRMIDSTKLDTYKTIGQIKQIDGGYWQATLFQCAWPAKPDSTSRNVIGLCQDIIAVPNVKIISSHDGICLGRY